jgi:putative selenate reductase
MSDKMYPMPFELLLAWVAAEKKKYGTIFGVMPAPPGAADAAVTYAGRELSLAFGPAAGPHTQMAQNIVCAYVAGARYFELKTVQIIDGENLHVGKPCIYARQEGYNVEWSTELTVEEAFEEYAKAWFLLHLLDRELYDGAGGGFIFNMSVGYDLAGIRSPKIDGFLTSMKDASGTDIWQQMESIARGRLDLFDKVSAGDVERTPPLISDAVTLSTLHGCPAADIEKIAAHLMGVKGLHTAVKCNPTLLGYDFVRAALDRTGYDYLQLDERAFASDLKFDQAVAMLGGSRPPPTAAACRSASS